MAKKTDWSALKREVLDKLDIRAEYEQLGVVVSGAKASKKGYLECHAIGHVDDTPSAGINIGDGPGRGLYKSFLDGAPINFFDFAAKYGPFAGDWYAAFKHYAAKVGVKLPTSDPDDDKSSFDFYDLTMGVAWNFATKKGGILPQAVFEVGGIGARRPKKLSAEKTNHLITFPMYGSAGLDAEPIGWHSIPQNPALKIRVYQGAGQEEKLLKTQTIGEYGLMNVWGLARIEHAEVVWIVEGISDLLALQSIIPKEGHTICLSAGGCTYHPKPEWSSMFAGKTIYIVFDRDKPGQAGASVWAGAMLPVAVEVKNIQLPFELEDNHGRDLRDYIKDGHGYDDLLLLASQTDPATPTDPTVIMSPREALLKNLGLIVIGEHEGSLRVEVFCERTRKNCTIGDISKLSFSTLVQLCGWDLVDEFVHEGREPPPGKVRLVDVRNAIADAASDRIYTGERMLGAGVWEVGGKLIMVKRKAVAIVDDNDIEISPVPTFGGRMLDLSTGSPDWFDSALMQAYWHESQNPEWRIKQFEQTEAMFKLWNWEQKPSSMILAAMVSAAWLQSTWDWRPLVAITGDSDTGKSMLTEECLKCLFGDLALYALKPSEAAVRQHIKHHSKVMLLDEFEYDSRRQAIWELLRTSGRGGEVIRGTTDHKGTKFGLHHIPFLVAIELGLKKQADLNRVIILELGAIPKEKRGKISLPSEEQLKDLGHRMLIVGLRVQQKAMAISAELRSTPVDGVPGRVVECFSLPFAIYAAIYDFDVETTASLMRKNLQRWGAIAGEFDTDKHDLIETILSAQIVMDGGNRKMVAEAIAIHNATGMPEALSRVGLKVFIPEDKEDYHLFFWQKALRGLLERTEFSSLKIDTYLLRLKGAIKTQIRIAGARPKGVAVPLSTISEIIKLSDSTNDTTPINKGDFDSGGHSAA